MYLLTALCVCHEFLGNRLKPGGIYIDFCLDFVIGGLLFRYTVQKAVLVACGRPDEIGDTMANRVLTALMRME